MRKPFDRGTARVSGAFRRLRRPPPAVDLALIAIGALAAILPFWQSGVASHVDMLIGIYRVFELDQAWRQGMFFPRIAPGLVFGLGAPLFEYYPPLASYLALSFHWAGLGWIEATKAVFSGSLLLAGLGAYVYARWLMGRRSAGLVAAAAYMLAPYLLYDVYQRGAAAEVLAAAVIPWLFWSTHRLVRTESRSAFWWSAVCSALLVLAHNVTALFTFPVLGCYLLALALRERALPRLRMVILCTGLGFGLSCFYWLPALAERGYSQIAARLTAAAWLQPVNNLVPLAGLVQRQWAFQYWGGLGTQVPLWQAAFVPIAALAVARQVRALRAPLLSLALILLAMLVLQLRCSAIFWEAMPLVRFIQFPWRLLGLASFCVAILLASLVCVPILPGIARPGLVAFLIVLVVYAGLRNADPRLSRVWEPITDLDIGQVDEYQRGRGDFQLYSDYMPTAMHVLPSQLSTSRAAGAAPRPLAAAPVIQVVSEGPGWLSLLVHAPAAFTLLLPRLYFPGWQVSVRARPVPTGAGGQLGLVAAPVPAGDYPVTARLGETPVRAAADIMTGLCVVIVAACACRVRAGRRAIAIAVGGVLLLGILVWAALGPAQPLHRPAEYAADFQGEIRLLGYELSPAQPRPGDTLALRLYWLTLKAPAGDYKVFSHLVASDDSTPIAQVDAMPLDNSFFTSRWDPGELVLDQQEVSIPADAKPGAYELEIGLYRPQGMQNLAVRGAAHVLPGDRVVLSSVVLQAK